MGEVAIAVGLSAVGVAVEDSNGAVTVDADVEFVVG